MCNPFFFANLLFLFVVDQGKKSYKWNSIYMAAGRTASVNVLKFRTLLFLFSSKMRVIKAGRHKIANREDPDQTASLEAVWSGSALFGLAFFLQKTSVWNFRTFTLSSKSVWVITWQNQQNECTKRRFRSAQSDQSLHCVLKEPQAFLVWTAGTLIRLSRCLGWSESSCDVQPHC